MFENLGIVTRAGKGAPLTHEEMDINIMTPVVATILNEIIVNSIIASYSLAQIILASAATAPYTADTQIFIGKNGDYYTLVKVKGAVVIVSNNDVIGVNLGNFMVTIIPPIQQPLGLRLGVNENGFPIFPSVDNEAVFLLKGFDAPITIVEAPTTVPYFISVTDGLSSTDGTLAVGNSFWVTLDEVMMELTSSDENVIAITGINEATGISVGTANITCTIIPNTGTPYVYFSGEITVVA